MIAKLFAIWRWIKLKIWARDARETEQEIQLRLPRGYRDPRRR